LHKNFERNGFAVAGHDVSPRFDKSRFKEKNIHIFDSFDKLIQALDTPRVVLMMVPAGKPVDKAIVSVKPHLARDDILIDAGNSFFIDTARRIQNLKEAGIRFIGMGVSGGESGALWGPRCLGASSTPAGIH
jgi:6-phosphogluconate dehydrogenase